MGDIIGTHGEGPGLEPRCDEALPTPTRPLASWTVLRFPIVSVLGFGFGGKRDDGGRVHTRVARAVGQVINLAVLVPVDCAIAAGCRRHSA